MGNFRVFYQLCVLGCLSVSSYGDEHLFPGLFVQRKHGTSIFYPDTNSQHALTASGIKTSQKMEVHMHKDPLTGVSDGLKPLAPISRFSINRKAFRTQLEV